MKWSTCGRKTNNNFVLKHNTKHQYTVTEDLIHNLVSSFNFVNNALLLKLFKSKEKSIKSYFERKTRLRQKNYGTKHFAINKTQGVVRGFSNKTSFEILLCAWIEAVFAL